MMCSGLHWPPGVPLPPQDWQERLRDYAMVKNLVNGDSIVAGSAVPVTERLLEFMSDPRVAALWHEFNEGRPRL